MAGAAQAPSFRVNRKFLAGNGDLELEVVAPGAASLIAALRSPMAPIPAGDVSLGSISASAAGATSIEFGERGGGGTVHFSGSAGASVGLGIFADGAKALRTAAPAPELSSAVALEHPAGTRFLVMHADYDIKAAAKGSVALGTGVHVTFGASGSGSGGFAVLRRFADTEPASAVFTKLFDSWCLPRQIDSANDLAPETWLVAEVDGSFAMQVGIQAGYDFSWIRQIPSGALQGDIGLRVELGASAAFGFEASGKYAVVVARETDAETLRLALFKMARKGWTFALDARAGVTGMLPPWFDKPRKAEDLVEAIFGLNNNQIIEVLRETRAFVNSNVSLQDKLAGVLMDLGGTAIEHATGLTEAQIRAAYEAGRQKAIAFLDKYDTLLKSGGPQLTSRVLALAGVQADALKSTLETLAAAPDASTVQAMLRTAAGKAGFSSTVTSLFTEAAVGPVTDILANSQAAARVRELASQALDLVSGDTLQQLLTFIRSKMGLDKIEAVVSQTDFDSLDKLLKSRIAAFLGTDEAVLADLQKVQAAIKAVFAHADKFFDAAVKAATTQQSAAFALRYARTTTATALVNVSFDMTKSGVPAAFRAAVNGDFGMILLQDMDGVTLNEAELTHSIARNVSSELTLPFGTATTTSELLSSAKLRVEEDNGRVLVYQLDTTDAEKERFSLFGARRGRDSMLTVAATLPLGVSNGVRVWRNSTFRYSYQYARAVVGMRSSQLTNEIGPLVQKYLPQPFALPAASFADWVSDLDKALDSLDPKSGTNDIGNTLITLSLATPPEWLAAWTKAPRSRKDRAYMDLSRALQARLKELVMFYAFSDPAAYADLDTAAAPIVYSCIPVSTNIQMNSSNTEVERFNTDTDLYWDDADVRQITAVVNSKQCLTALSSRLNTISAVLNGIPELRGTAQFYAHDQVDEIIRRSLKRFSSGSNLPELLSSLLFTEARLIDNAVDTGVEMARFREAAGQNPAEALKKLAAFGEQFAKTFNSCVGRNAFLNGAARPLGTLLFAEAARAFDPGISGSIAAMMKVTVIRDGKLTVDQMLAGGIDDAPNPKELILFSQPFIQA